VNVLDFLLAGAFSMETCNRSTWGTSKQKQFVNPFLVKTLVL